MFVSYIEGCMFYSFCFGLRVQFITFFNKQLLKTFF